MDHFLAFGQTISSLDFQCHSVSGEGLAVVMSTPFLDERAMVDPHVVALICKQRWIHLSICGPDLANVVLSLKTRTWSNVDGVIQLASRHQL